MRILLCSPDHARHIGKRLARRLDVPLTRGHAVAALVLGYRSWNELLDHCTWSSGYSNSLAAWPDRQCMPAAVAARRAFQVEALAKAMGLPPERARTLVDEIRPSDGVARPEMGDGQVPRTHDPRLSLEDHRTMSAELYSVWIHSGRRRYLDEALKRIATRLENLWLLEWPQDQFCTTYQDGCYCGLSPTYLHELERAPLWIRGETFAADCLALQAIERRVAAANVADLAHLMGEVNAAVARALAHLRRWRLESAAHDDEPIEYVGTPLIEDEAVVLLETQGQLDRSERLALKFPDMAEDAARRLLGRLTQLPEPDRTSAPARYAARKLELGLTRLDRSRALDQRRREPLARTWALWGVSGTDAVFLERRSAAVSLDARAAGPAYLGGRVVAVPAGAALVVAGQRFVEPEVQS